MTISLFDIVAGVWISFLVQLDWLQRTVSCHAGASEMNLPPDEHAAAVVLLFEEHERLMARLDAHNQLNKGTAATLRGLASSST